MSTAALTARTHFGQGLFSDANLDRFGAFIARSVRIPGTSIHVGIDALIDRVPVAGEAMAGLTSGALVAAAWFRGVPYVTLARMAVNFGVEMGIGAIPVLGETFGLVWRADHRNHRLLMRHLRAPHHHTWKDYAFLLGLAAVLLAILAIPVLVMVGLGVWFAHRV